MSDSLVRRNLPYIVIIGVVIALAYGPSITESRWYRDLTLQTPFYDVVIEHTRVDGQKMSVWGTFKKRRCRNIGENVYVRDNNGVLWPSWVTFQGDPKGTPFNRPPSRDAQQFGPWVIESTIKDPQSAVLIKNHICSKGELQSNLFFDMTWADYDIGGDHQ